MERIARFVDNQCSDAAPKYTSFSPSASELRNPLPVIKMNIKEEFDYTEIEALPKHERFFYTALAVEARTWMRLENNEWLQMVEHGIGDMSSVLSDTSDTESIHESDLAHNGGVNQSDN